MEITTMDLFRQQLKAFNLTTAEFLGVLSLVLEHQEPSVQERVFAMSTPEDLMSALLDIFFATPNGVLNQWVKEQGILDRELKRSLHGSELFYEDIE